ncbi:ATP-binding protein [Streptomyces poonensis]|uniref:ATPase n=1 Tax=Streptomyces poonensis TaxID=68255 RepID=A0A918UEE6_9ACTN|nr:ATP-binding protein [Streptomyces poonensis]GGZ00341.1 ATPase [Streptomyces poonensis]GLJ92121.1 ATPase [Streptomyces poonensis]
MRERYQVRAAPHPVFPSGPPHGPRSPAEARIAVRQAVAERAADTGCDESALADALLVVSELTTNAMLHGGGVTDVDVTVRGGDLYLSVSDRSRRLPVALTSVDECGRKRCGGRGWPIVCRLSREVTLADLPSGGKRITAVVPLRASRRRTGGTCL